MRSLNRYISTTERISSIDDYINEKFQIGNDYKRQYAYTPKNKDELIEVIQNKIEKEGFGTKNKPLDLNDIDTSKITDMNHLFAKFYSELNELSENGYFDISDWDVSNVEDMHSMFYESEFNGDISDWDVSNVEDMEGMFYKSSFTGKNGDISDWDVSKVKDMSFMFADSNFDGNLSKWNVNNIEDMQSMFTNCPIENNPPKWYHE